MIHENTVKFKFYFSVTVCVHTYLQVSMYVCADLCKSKGSSLGFVSQETSTFVF